MAPQVWPPAFSISDSSTRGWVGGGICKLIALLWLPALGDQSPLLKLILIYLFSMYVKLVPSSAWLHCFPWWLWYQDATSSSVWTYKGWLALWWSFISTMELVSSLTLVTMFGVCCMFFKKTMEQAAPQATHRLGDKQYIYFSQFCRLGSPRPRFWQTQFLMKALFLAYRWNLFAGFSHGGEKESKLCDVSWLNGTNPIMQAPPSWPHLT